MAKKILFFNPVYHYKEPLVEDNHRLITRYASCAVDSLKMSGRSVEHNKSAGYREFLKGDWDYFMNVDCDIINNNPKNRNMINELIKHGKKVVGGIYVCKRGDFHPAHRDLKLQKIYEETGEFPKDYVFDIPKELHKVQWLAGGAMLIAREVIEKLTKKHLIPNLPMIYKGQYLSEDWAFSQRCREEGYEIWADPNLDISHMGLYGYTLKDYYEYKKMEVEDGR